MKRKKRPRARPKPNPRAQKLDPGAGRDGGKAVAIARGGVEAASTPVCCPNRGVARAAQNLAQLVPFSRLGHGFVGSPAPR